MKPRCDHCRYWEDGEVDADLHADERRGACHRNAPRPTMGNWEYQVLNQLTHITWEHCKELEKKNFESWEEAHEEFIVWPSTLGKDWCGAFKAKKETVKKKSEETNHAKGRLLLEAKPSG